MPCASIATATGETLPLFPLRIFVLIFIFFKCMMMTKKTVMLFTGKCSFFLLYRNTRSESCPFCRGSLKRVNSEDLWVLTCGNDVVDTETALKDDVLRFFLFINNLPKDIPDALFVMYYEYLF